MAPHIWISNDNTLKHSIRDGTNIGNAIVIDDDEEEEEEDVRHSNAQTRPAASAVNGPVVSSPVAVLDLTSATPPASRSPNNNNDNNIVAELSGTPKPAEAVRQTYTLSWGSHAHAQLSDAAENDPASVPGANDELPDTAANSTISSQDKTTATATAMAASLSSSSSSQQRGRNGSLERVSSQRHHSKQRARERGGQIRPGAVRVSDTRLWEDDTHMTDQPSPSAAEVEAELYCKKGRLVECPGQNGIEPHRTTYSPRKIDGVTKYGCYRPHNEYGCEYTVSVVEYKTMVVKHMMGAVLKSRMADITVEKEVVVRDEESGDGIQMTGVETTITGPGLLTGNSVLEPTDTVVMMEGTQDSELPPETVVQADKPDTEIIVVDNEPVPSVAANPASEDPKELVEPSSRAEDDTSGLLTPMVVEIAELEAEVPVREAIAKLKPKPAEQPAPITASSPTSTGNVQRANSPTLDVSVTATDTVDNEDSEAAAVLAKSSSPSPLPQPSMPTLETNNKTKSKDTSAARITTSTDRPQIRTTSKPSPKKSSSSSAHNENAHVPPITRSSANKDVCVGCKRAKGRIEGDKPVRCQVCKRAWHRSCNADLSDMGYNSTSWTCRSCKPRKPNTRSSSVASTNNGNGNGNISGNTNVGNKRPSRHSLGSSKINGPYGLGMKKKKKKNWEEERRSASAGPSITVALPTGLIREKEGGFRRKRGRSPEPKTNTVGESRTSSLRTRKSPRGREEEKASENLLDGDNGSVDNNDGDEDHEEEESRRTGKSPSSSAPAPTPAPAQATSMENESREKYRADEFMSRTAAAKKRNVGLTVQAGAALDSDGDGWESDIQPPPKRQKHRERSPSIVPETIVDVNVEVEAIVVDELPMEVDGPSKEPDQESASQAEAPEEEVVVEQVEQEEQEEHEEQGQEGQEEEEEEEEEEEQEQEEEEEQEEAPREEVADKKHQWNETEGYQVAGVTLVEPRDSNANTNLTAYTLPAIATTTTTTTTGSKAIIFPKESLMRVIDIINMSETSLRPPRNRGPETLTLPGRLKMPTEEMGTAGSSGLEKPFPPMVTADTPMDIPCNFEGLQEPGEEHETLPVIDPADLDIMVELRKLRNNYFAARDRCRFLETEVKRYQSHIVELNKVNARYQTQARELDGAMERDHSHNEELEVLKRKCLKLEDEVARETAKAESLLERLEDQQEEEEARLAAVKEKANRYRVDAEKARENCEGLQRRVEILEREVEEMASAGAGETGTLVGTLAHARGRYYKAEKEVEALRAKVRNFERVQAELEDANERYHQLESETENQAEKLESAEDDKDKLIRELESAKKQLDLERKKLADVTTKSSEDRKRLLRGSNVRADWLGRRLQEALAQNTLSQTKLKEAEKLKISYLDLQRKYERVDEENGRLRDQVRETMRAKGEVDRDLERTKALRANYETEFLEKSTEVDRLRSLSEEAEGVLARERAELENLKLSARIMSEQYEDKVREADAAKKTHDENVSALFRAHRKQLEDLELANKTLRDQNNLLIEKAAAGFSGEELEALKQLTRRLRGRAEAAEARVKELEGPLDVTVDERSKSPTPSSSSCSVELDFDSWPKVPRPMMPEPGVEADPVGDLPEGYRVKTSQPWKERYEAWYNRNPRTLHLHRSCKRNLPVIEGEVRVFEQDGSECLLEDDQVDLRGLERKRGPMTFDVFRGIDQNEVMPVVLEKCSKVMFRKAEKNRRTGGLSRHAIIYRTGRNVPGELRG